MISKKNIVVAAVLTALTAGFSVAYAGSASNLLQMDVKRSSAADSVDVTFYTTGDSTNSVVTRKSNNRYVVLLPNTAGSASIVPSLGGVKDLITDVQVKNVDDGIGGYTKVTFETVKPVNIRTYMKKTSPLTQAQKDYKNLIAQNNKPAVQPQAQTKKTEPAVNTTPVKQASVAPKTTTTSQTQTKPQVKPVQSNNAQKASTPAAKAVSAPKVNLVPVTPPKAKSEPVKPVQPKVVQQKPVQPKVQQEPSQKVERHVSIPFDNYVPKMKFDKNGKRQIDLEPRVKHKIVEEKPSKTVKKDSIFDVPQETQAQQVQNQVEEQTVPVENSASETSKTHHFPMWIMIGGGVGVVLLAAFLVFDAVSHASEKDSDRLKSFFNISSKNQARRRRREFQDIINDDNLNWQEKYKKYTEKDKQLHPVKKSEDMSYVTDMSATKKAIIAPQEAANRGFETDRRALRNDNYAQNLHSQSSNVQNNSKFEENVSKSPSMLNFKQVTDSIQNIPNNKEEELKEQMRAKISQMEHSLSQTPNLEPPEEISNEVRSEDNAILGTFSDIKLKSFAKKPTLKESHRSLLEEDKKLSRNKSYKEGRFVKLKNSPLSVSRRKSTSSELEVSDLMGTGNKYLTNNNGEMKMDKQNENYLLSSLDEYLSILDSEDQSRMATMEKSSVADTLAQVKPSMAMSRSGITNPIARGSNPMNKQKNEPTHYMNGLIVKSGYNIDAEKGFYVVNLDGVSALVGRIKDNIFILKKFDYVVDKPLQVRLDYGSVYIVKVGGFKCLVDVSKEKMGTLIEI